MLLLSRNGSETPIEHTAAPVRGYFGRGARRHPGIPRHRQAAAVRRAVDHAQKMDAMARLAGGVAGDFNNLLTVISGYAELLRQRDRARQRDAKYADEIPYAGERAAALTRHLLAFSRGTAAARADPRSEPDAHHMEPMLRRLLGPEYRLLLILPRSGLGHIRVDGAQIEQVIVNLATNARDAMPNGGKLVLETANVDWTSMPPSGWA